MAKTSKGSEETELKLRVHLVLSPNRCPLTKRTTAYQHAISSKKLSGRLISVSAWYVHLNIYLCFSLNDRRLITVISLALVSLGFTVRTVKTQKISLRFLLFLPNIFPSRGSNLYPPTAISLSIKVHASPTKLGHQNFMLNLNSILQSCCGGMEHMENHLPQSLKKKSKYNLPFLTDTDLFAI